MKFTKGINDEETLDAESGKVVAFLSALPRVEAPSNFEFGVKAKIAQGAPRPVGSLIRFLKLAAPLSLLLVVGAFVFYYATLPSGDSVATVESVKPSVNPVTTSETSSPALEPENISGPRVSEQAEPTTERASVPATPTQNRAGTTRRTDANVADGGNSMTIIQRSAPVIMPPGLEGANPRTSGGADIPVKDVLGILGITPEFAAAGWKVRSVTDNSVAARSGVKPEDVIEAVDGRDLSADSTVKGDSGVRTLRVRRDGKQMDIAMKY